MIFQRSRDPKLWRPRNNLFMMRYDNSRAYDDTQHKVERCQFLGHPDEGVMCAVTNVCVFPLPQKLVRQHYNIHYLRGKITINTHIHFAILLHK